MADVLERLKVALTDRYTIDRELGSGGMATVYLAEDMKHHRQVALKVLRPELAAVLGAERFVQEITTTANLQHPHILPLFDSGEADGFLYYVMPFIDGETLRDKLNRETQLGIEEAVKITTDVADALDSAHQLGVIHRDIKPENILLHKGRPMVADFGIALAVSAAAGGRMTETGLSLGTPHYMSPEQATAEKDLTNRSDIYSLGCVLYEMLTGEPPHTGASAQAIVMKIVTDDVRPVTELRKSVPPHVAAATAKSLEKLAADRFESAKAFAEALTNPAFTLPTTQAAMAGAPASGPWNRVAIGFAALAALLAVVALWGWLRPRQMAEPAVRKTSIVLPDTAPLALIGSAPLSVGRPALALSDDGTLLAYVAEADPGTQLYLRRLGEYETYPVAGTEGAFHPFFSPDGQWIAFFAGNKLKKVSIHGGEPLELCEVANPYGGAWGLGGRIYFTPHEGRTVSWVSSNGGEPEVLISGNTSGLNTTGFFWPQVLPGSTHLLVTADPEGTIAITIANGDANVIIPDVFDARYVQSGHVVYVQGMTLMAMRFDASRMEVVGSTFPVVDSVRTESAWNAGQYAVASDGTLVYVPGNNGGIGALGWVDRSGVYSALAFPSKSYGTFEISPDGGRLVISDGPLLSDIWMYDLQRQTPRRLTNDGGNAFPVWMPDGRSVIWGNLTDGVSSVRRTDLQSIQDPVHVGTSQHFRWPSSVTSDGSVLAVVEINPVTLFDIWLQPLTGSDTAWAFANSPHNEWGLVFSPDDSWVAYTTDETGDYEIWVEPYPNTGQSRWQISTGGGEEPRWSADGRVLYYRSSTRLMAVEMTYDSSGGFGTPSEVFSGQYINSPGPSFDVEGNGSRFLVLKGTEDVVVHRLNVVTGFFEELKQRVGNGND